MAGAQIFTGELPQNIRFINGTPQMIAEPTFRPPMIRPPVGPPAGIAPPGGVPVPRVPAGVPAVRTGAGLPSVINPATQNAARGSLRAAGMAAIPAMGTEVIGRMSLAAGNQVQNNTLANYPYFGNEDNPAKANPMYPNSREGMARRNEVMGISQSATDRWREKPHMLSSHAKPTDTKKVKEPPKPEVAPTALGQAPKVAQPEQVPQIPRIEMPPVPSTPVMGLAEAIPSMPNSMGEVIAGQQIAGAQMQRADLANGQKLDAWRTQVGALPQFANANTAMGKLELDQQMTPLEMKERQAQTKTNAQHERLYGAQADAYEAALKHDPTGGMALGHVPKAPVVGDMSEMGKQLIGNIGALGQDAPTQAATLQKLKGQLTPADYNALALLIRSQG